MNYTWDLRDDPANYDDDGNFTGGGDQYDDQPGPTEATREPVEER